MAHRLLLALAIATGALVGGPLAHAAGDPPGIDAARAGLAAYLAASRPESPTTSTNVPGCPAIALDRLQEAIVDVGIDGPIADWSTTIDRNEYADIDPELIGIRCGADADGDSLDGDFEMSASVVAVDAVDDERAQEVRDLLGYGALTIEPADVPGGELANICIDDSENSLSMCMSLWSSDGFVLGVVLASDVQDIPDGAASAVLEDTLPDILATLADVTVAPSPTTDASTDVSSEPAGPAETTADSSLDVAGARAGLDSLTAGMESIDEFEPLPECPAVDRDAVVAALETAGIDSPIATFDREDGPTLGDGTTWTGSGVVCTGSYVGSDGDESFPETTVDLVVAVVGDEEAFTAYVEAAAPGISTAEPLPTPTIGGGTFGQCEHRDRTEQCVEYWVQDGLAIGIHITDQLAVDRPTASAVLVALVPDVVDMLVRADGGEPGASAANVTVPADVIEAARQHVAALSGELLVECPFIDPATIDAELADAGIAIEPGDDWSGAPASGSEDALAGIACSGAGGSSTVSIEVLDFSGPDAAEDVIELVRWCRLGENLTWCVESWQQDGLAVTVIIEASGVDVERAEVVGLLEALVPVVLDNLAAAVS